MKTTCKLIGLLLFSLFVVACTDWDPEGTVVGKKFDEGHYYTDYQQQYVGENCYPRSTVDVNGNPTVRTECTSDYRSVPVQRYDDDDWYLKVNRCAADDEEKCKTFEEEVDEDVYDEAHKGMTYNTETDSLE